MIFYEKSGICKVLFVTNSADLGGASHSFLSVLKGLPEEHFKAFVVLPEDGPLKKELDAVGVWWAICYQSWWVTSGTDDAWLYTMNKLTETVDTLRAVIKDNKIDLICTNSSVIPAGAFAAALEQKPHVWIVREFIGKGEFQGPLSPEIIRDVMLTLSSHIIAISSSLASEYKSGPSSSRVHTVHAGIDCMSFSDVHPVFEEPVIVSIGTNSEAKGLTDLVETAGIIKDRGVPFKINLIGEFYHKDYMTSIGNRLKKLEISDKFEFIGFQKDIRPWLKQASVYCCPSHTEGMSRTIIEAMASGLPVVSTDCGGPSDLVKDGVTGRLVPTCNPVAMAEALIEILGDRQKAAAMGEIGKKRAIEQFDVNHTVPEFIYVLKRALHENRPASEHIPLLNLILDYMKLAGPRVLLGKKWRLLRKFI